MKMSLANLQIQLSQELPVQTFCSKANFLLSLQQKDRLSTGRGDV